MRPLLIGLVLVGSVVAVPAVAAAQSESEIAEARDRARPLAEKAYAHFQAGRWSQAIELFQQAEEHFHAPPHLLYIARAQVELGQLVAARDNYRTVASEQLAPYAPDPFRQAQLDAKQELTALRKRIPSLQIVVSGGPGGEPQVSVDGRALEEVPPLLEVDPGDHEVTATAGALTMSRKVVVAEGDRQRVELDLPGSRATDDDAGPGLWVPAVAVFGLAVANVVVGAVTGAISLGQVSDIEERCVDGHCPPDAEPDADDAALMGHLSTASFIIAGVATAVGTTLLVVDLTGDEPATTAMRITAGPAGGALVLSF